MNKLQRQIVQAIKQALARNDKMAIFKKMLMNHKPMLTEEQWLEIYQLFENEKIAHYIVKFALDGKTPQKATDPLEVRFYWANRRIKSLTLNSLPLGEGRVNFNAALAEVIDIINRTYRSSGDRSIPKISFGPYAIKLTGKENSRYLFKLFNDGEIAVIYHVWQGTSTEPHAKRRAAAEKAAADYKEFDPDKAIPLEVNGDWMYESIEVGEILNFIVLSEAKEEFK